jgi:hypothetical protein
VYNTLKTELSNLLGISKDALHIHLGLALYLLVALVFRRRLSSWLPWLALLAFEIVNELVDIFHVHGGVMGFELGDSLKDVINTMFWPTVVLVVARTRAAQPSGAAATSPDPHSDA